MSIFPRNVENKGDFGANIIIVTGCKSIFPESQLNVAFMILEISLRLRGRFVLTEMTQLLLSGMIRFK